jgi:hypothetical protein
LSCLVLSCLVLSCLVLSCLVLSCLVKVRVRVKVRVGVGVGVRVGVRVRDVIILQRCPYLPVFDNAVFHRISDVPRVVVITRIDGIPIQVQR